MRSRFYPTDLNDAEWECLAPLLLSIEPRGRPRKHPVREIFDAGAQRISVGGRLTWVAVAAARNAAEELLRGNLGALDAAPPPEQWLS